LLLGAVTLGGVLATGCQPPQPGASNRPGNSAPVASNSGGAVTTPVPDNTPAVPASPDPAASQAPAAHETAALPSATTSAPDSPATGGARSGPAGLAAGDPDQVSPPGGEDVADNDPPSTIDAGAGDGAAGLPEFPGPTGETGTEVGDTIPEISGKDPDKKNFKLTEYRGRVVMLDFWGDW
jgi:hypothetical protein